MRRLFLTILAAAPAAMAATAPEPSETDLAGITYFAPICPFYYRMMGPDGELREFQLVDGGTFKSPRGWAADMHDNGRITVRGPHRRRYVYENGRLVTYISGKDRHNITYPFEPAYGGKPAPLWRVEPQEIDREKMQRRLDKMTDIWSMTGRYAMWFKSPNAAGGLLACVALLGAALFIGRGPVRVFTGLAVMAASLGGMVMTSSRGAIVAFVAGFAILLLAAVLRRSEHPVGKRVIALFGCLALAAVFAVATQGVKRFTRDFSRTIEGRGEGRDRSAIFAAGVRMMADAPDGWGVRQAGPAYSHWYQSMGGDTWQMTLVSDQLTHLVGYGWFGRWLWIFGWLTVAALLWKFAMRGFGAGGVAVWVALLTASTFNVMLAQFELWVLPAAFAGLFVFRMIRGEWREWRGYLKWFGIGAAASVAATAALYIVCTASEPSSPRIRHERGNVIVGEGEPKVWIVDDGETLGGIYTQNLIRRHYLRNAASNSVPACAYCRGFGGVPDRVDRLVLAGAQGERFVALQRGGHAPLAKEVVFVSPPFNPKKGIDSTLFGHSRVAVLLGEFAARYVDVYGEGPQPKWVSIVKGAELYIPNWTDFVIGGGK